MDPKNAEWETNTEVSAVCPELRAGRRRRRTRTTTKYKYDIL
jgi:hypothetical protein